MQLKPNERRRAFYRKLRRFLIHPLTWKVITGIGQALAWLWMQTHPPR